MRSFSDDEIACIASRARVLGDPARVRIVNALARGEHSVDRLALVLAIDKSTLSEHLQVLFNVGLVQRCGDATAVVYAIETGDLIGVCHVLGRPLLHCAAIIEGRMDSSRDRRASETSNVDGS